MRVVFIQPSVGRKADGTSYPAAWRMEPLGIARLAALTPPDVGRVFFDDRLEPVDTETPADLACLAVETFTARRAYQIADASRVAIFEYVILPASAFWSWALWGETLGRQAWMGIGLIIAAGAMIVIRAESDRA